MLALRLPKEIEDRLKALAKRTGHTKSQVARRAIVEQLDDLEDTLLAEQALADASAKRYSLDDIKGGRPSSDTVSMFKDYLPRIK